MVTGDTRVMTVAVRIHRLLGTLVFGFLLLSGSSASFAQTRLDGVVVSDHDAAIRAGMGILEQGGNAVDAAVATAFALAVVEPASSGLGGGGVMVIYQSKEKKAHALDFTEVSPAAAGPGLYRKEDGIRQDLLEAGALAVAVPGTVAGLTEALKRFGSLPLETVLAPAIRHAAAGFPVTRRLRRVIEENLPALRQRANFSRIFLTPSGAPHDVGEMIRQPELAETLKTMAREGAAGFYEGRRRSGHRRTDQERDPGRPQQLQARVAPPAHRRLPGTEGDHGAAAERGGRGPGGAAERHGGLRPGPVPP